MSRIQINKKFIIIFLLLVPLFEPDYIGVKMPLLHDAYLMGKILSFLVCTTIFLTQSFKIKFRQNRGVLFYIGFWLFLVINTIVKNQYIIGMLSAFIIIMTLVFLFWIYQNNIWILLSALLFVYEILIYSNLISMILYPRGLYTIPTIGEYWLLGLDNAFITIMLPASCLAEMFISKGYFSIRGKVLIVTIVLTLVIRWAVTPMIAMTIFFAVTICPIKKIRKALNPKCFLILMCIGTFLFVVLNFQSYFSFIIVDILHKDVTFSSRTIIWGYAMKKIALHPWLGYGHLLPSTYETILRGTHPHNQILLQLFQGGILGLTWMIVIYGVVCKKINQYSNDISTKYLGASISAFFFMGISESNGSTNFQILIIIALFIDVIMKSTKTDLEHINDKTTRVVDENCRNNSERGKGCSYE